jgi:hypothetical protein
MPSAGAMALPAPLAVEQLIRIAHVQRGFCRNRGIKAPLAGDLVLTEVTAGGIEQRIVGEYPDADEIRELPLSPYYSRERAWEVETAA